MGLQLRFNVLVYIVFFTITGHNIKVLRFFGRDVIDFSNS